MDDALKTRGIVYLNFESWLLFVPPSKFLPHACPHMTRNWFRIM